MSNHWFWNSIALLSIVWYSTITIYVAIRGSFDIRHMLDRLKETAGENGPPAE
ncbi:MAG: hypothetical protein JNG89_03350 [Planctomycetaceae bacterium]|nr:hypothetical protein [Planctomycetaceae bacterium]